MYFLCQTLPLDIALAFSKTYLDNYKIYEVCKKHGESLRSCKIGWFLLKISHKQLLKGKFDPP